MTSSAKVAANRRNAQRSTGPRSPEGRTRTRYNALKHGLATPIWVDPSLAERAKGVAEALAAGSHDGAVQETAQRAAEATIEALRVRTARTQLMSRAFAAREPTPNPIDFVPDRLLGKVLLSRRASKRDSLEQAIGWIQIDAAEQLKDRRFQDRRSSTFMKIERQLMALERYERRALSKRNSAFRELAVFTKSRRDDLS